jgi:hypothetical protein
MPSSERPATNTDPLPPRVSTPSTSELQPEELEPIELPERHALSMFTGGLGHFRIDPPPAILEDPAIDESTET